MSSLHRDLTDSQWARLDSLIPEPQRRKDGRGRAWRGRREVLDGILFILRTGAAWADLPERYPPYQTCHRRFQPLRYHAGHLRGSGRGAAAPRRISSRRSIYRWKLRHGEKRGRGVGKTKRGKG